MDENKNSEKEKVVPEATEEKKVEDTEETPAPSQDPIKTELEKVQTAKRTKKEKLLYTKKRIEDQLKEFGEDSPHDKDIENDDDSPVTVGMLNKIEQDKAINTALSMAEEIENEHERELVKHHLNETIKSTGDPQKDLKNARLLVNSLKNSQIATETARKTTPSGHSSGAGNPANREEAFEPTAEEMVFMKPPYNMSKEEIIKSRK